MKTYLGPGERIAYANSAAVSSGDVVLSGVTVLVACGAFAANETGSYLLDGAHTLAKATGQTWTVGAQLYWDNTNKNFTTTSSGNTAAGKALAAAASGDTTGKVKINR